MASSNAASPSDPPAHHVKEPSLNPWGARFANIWGGYTDKSLADVRRWKSGQTDKTIDYAGGHLQGKGRPTVEDFRAAFPVHPLDAGAWSQPDPDPTTVQALWVGHATALVQMAGLTFITDPVFSERCSPVQFLGPKRVTPPSLQPESPELPDLDFVLISHNHYDHLDTASVKRLNKRFGEKLIWYVPLGLKSWFKGRGLHSNVIELDWWQSVKHRDTEVSIIMTPAQHWSNRGLHDKYHTLWGGFVVQAPKAKFWFAGDTGYCPVFKEIGERLGPIDLAAIPIGAYEPRWFMANQHVDTSEALLIHRDVKARRSFGIHCCTFALTDEPMDEPPRKLAAEISSTPGWDPTEFITLQHGAMIKVRDGNITNTPQTLPVN